MKNNMIVRTIKIMAASLILVIVAVVNGYSGTQNVSFFPISVTVSGGQTAAFVLNYDVIEGAKKTTGLGIRVFYDSQVVEKASLLDVFGEGLVAVDDIAMDDLKDLDNDPRTDKYISAAWIGVTGDWPSFLKLPLTLGNLNLKIKQDIPPGSSSNINITASSTPQGYVFQAVGGSVLVP